MRAHLLRGNLRVNRSSRYPDVVGHNSIAMAFSCLLCERFLVAAISPAVVVLGLLPLRQRGYGTAQGIPTLLIAAATGDDVVDISGFSLCFALTFGEGQWHVR